MINKTFIIIISICLIQSFANNSYTVGPDEILENQRQELRAPDISKNIRCMVCQNQSIDDSDAPLAKDLRILIRNKIKGKNQSIKVVNLKGGLRRMKSPYLSVKNLYISWSFLPSFIWSLINILKSFASGAFESSID